MDSHEPLFFRNEDSYTFENFMLEKSKEKDKDGISIISDMGAFFYSGDSQKNRELLFSFEYSLPRKLAKDINRVCLYHKNDINRFDKREKELLSKSHSRCIFTKQLEKSVY